MTFTRAIFLRLLVGCWGGSLGFEDSKWPCAVLNLVAIYGLQLSAYEYFVVGEMNGLMV